MSFKLGVLLLFTPLCNSQGDSSKWVWSDGRSRNDNAGLVNSDKRYNGELASLAKPLFQANSNYNGDRQLSYIKNRYEVTESTYPSDYNTYRPQLPDQYKPGFSTYRPTNNYRPDFIRPPDYRPTNRPYENEYRPLGNGYRPPDGDYYLNGLRPGIGTNGRPILTGPTPSWEEDDRHKYKDYDICKCVHSFNCNTPGIKFGSCDTDKQYCCYKNKQNEGHENNRRPITNIYKRPRPVLAGPGGPVDGPGKRPYQNKGPSGRPYQPDGNKYSDIDRELNEAYKKGLASALYELYQRPSAYYESDPQGYREYYNSDRDYYKDTNSFKSSHPSKYGLYDPSVSVYGRSSNSSIAAISDVKN